MTAATALRARLRAMVVTVLAVLPLLVPSKANAQEVRVAVDPGPHYVGDAVSIRITAAGFEAAPTPVVAVDPPASGRLELLGVSPNVSQSITIINGRMTRTRDVTHVFQFRFVGDVPGVANLGPFRITQGTGEVTVQAVRLKVQSVPTNEDVSVNLELRDGDLYVGERIPVTIRFTLERGLQQNVLTYELRAPLFDQQQDFRFQDIADPAGATKVTIETRAGRLELQGSSQTIVRGAKRYVTVSVTRTMIPLRAGRYELPPTTLAVEEGVRWRRDFFGGRRATHVRRWGAKAPARTIVVKSIPRGERPPSFAGTVGRGFTLEVAADRTVVQVGDPITLTLTLQGEGLEAAGLPPLDADGLLPIQSFRVPAGDLTGELEGDSKHFTAIVRVLDERVQEVPALAYSWFDPSTQRFETTHSRPIALSVRSAEVIGAAEVQIDAELARSSALNPDEAPRARSFALTGADLAIEPDPARVLGGSESVWRSAWLQGGLYAGSLLLVPLAWLDRRRREVDPALRARRAVLSAEFARVRATATLPPVEAAEQLAQSLRRMVAQVPDAGSAELETFLGECDALRYAPGRAGSATAAPDDLVERGVEIAQQLAERPR